MSEHLAAASGVRIIIDAAAVPIHPSVHAMTRRPRSRRLGWRSRWRGLRAVLRGSAGSVERMVDELRPTRSICRSPASARSIPGRAYAALQRLRVELPYSGFRPLQPHHHDPHASGSRSMCSRHHSVQPDLVVIGSYLGASPRFYDQIPRCGHAGSCWATVECERRRAGPGEHLARQAQIIVSNHVSWYDVLALAAWIPKRYRFVGKKELTRVPLWGRAWQAPAT
jgi:hypothetical protein